MAHARRSARGVRGRRRGGAPRDRAGPPARSTGRLAHLGLFRRRIVEMPGRLDRPVWEDDARARCRRAPSRTRPSTRPGGDASSDRLVGEIFGRPLDRSRPLWELWRLDGLRRRRRRPAAEDPPRVHRRACTAPSSRRSSSTSSRTRHCERPDFARRVVDDRHARRVRLRSRRRRSRWRRHRCARRASGSTPARAAPELARFALSRRPHSRASVPGTLRARSTDAHRPPRASSSGSVSRDDVTWSAERSASRSNDVVLAIVQRRVAHATSWPATRSRPHHGRAGADGHPPRGAPRRSRDRAREPALGDGRGAAGPPRGSADRLRAVQASTRSGTNAPPSAGRRPARRSRGRTAAAGAVGAGAGLRVAPPRRASAAHLQRHRLERPGPPDTALLRRRAAHARLSARPAPRRQRAQHHGPQLPRLDRHRRRDLPRHRRRRAGDRRRVRTRARPARSGHTGVDRVPTTFLVLSLVGALLALDALFPRSRRSIFAVPSFFAAWPTTELSPQFLFVQVLGAAAFVWLGALEDVAGFVALGITIASWTGLAVIGRRPWQSGAFVEAALAEGLGHDYTATLGEVADVTASHALPVIRLALAVPIADRTIEVVRDLRYAPGAGRRHRLDVYRAAGSSARSRPRPVCKSTGELGSSATSANKRDLSSTTWLRTAGCASRRTTASVPRQPSPTTLLDVQAGASVGARAHRGVRRRPRLRGGHGGIGRRSPGHTHRLHRQRSRIPARLRGRRHLGRRLRSLLRRVRPQGKIRRPGRRRHGRSDRADRPQTQACGRPGSVLARVTTRPDTPCSPTLPRRARHPRFPRAGYRGPGVRRPARDRSASPVVYVELPGTQHAFELFHSVRSETVVRGVHRFLAAVYFSRRGSCAP